MEARAVTAGLPALVAEEGLPVGPGLSVSFTYRGVGSRAQAVGTIGSGDFGFVAGRLMFGQSNQTFSKSRLETNLRRADRAWRLKVWRETLVCLVVYLVCCWCCGGPASNVGGAST